MLSSGYCAGSRQPVCVPNAHLGHLGLGGAGQWGAGPGGREGGSRFGTAHIVTGENYALLRGPPVGLKPNYKPFGPAGWAKAQLQTFWARRLG